MPLARRFRTVLEQVAEVRPAAGAIDLGAGHAIAVVRDARHVGRVELAEEAWPAGAAVEFVLAGEERQAANDAVVEALFLVVEQVAAEGGLSAGLLGDLVLLRRELRGQFFDTLGAQGGDVEAGL